MYCELANPRKGWVRKSQLVTLSESPQSLENSSVRGIFHLRNFFLADRPSLISING
jgi:hypothetical protein